MSDTPLRDIRSLSLGALAARAAVVTAIVGVAVLLWYIIDVVVLVFAGVVLAVALRSLVAVVARYTPLRGVWALVVVAVALLVGLVGLGTLIGSRVVDQLGQLTHTLHQAWLQLHAELEKSGLGRAVLHVESKTAAGASAARLAGAATSSIGALITVIVILFVGWFLAIEPDLYRRGMLSLIPARARAAATETLDELGHALQRWLLGVLIAMLCVGALSSISLALIGIPLALSLGILAGICEFVPYVGPIVASIPAILVAFTLGATPAIEVAGLYLLVHALEGYVLVPIIQKRTVALPPALALIAVVLFGLMFGPLGVILAHPLMVTVIVLTKRFYI
jgi:predicted PurR-regulated permease PerM